MAKKAARSTRVVACEGIDPSDRDQRSGEVQTSAGPGRERSEKKESNAEQINKTTVNHY